jgi:hypothetical protein
MGDAERKGALDWRTEVSDAVERALEEGVSEEDVRAEVEYVIENHEEA